MIVLSDTTPLNYLVLIGQIDLLPRLYQQVVVPKLVVDELRHDHAPQSVRTWVENAPIWLEIREVEMSLKHRTAHSIEANLRRLSWPNNFMRISCSWMNAMDATKPRAETYELADAASEKLIDLPQVLEQLQQTNFFISPRVLQSLLDRFNKSRPSASIDPSLSPLIALSRAAIADHANHHRLLVRQCLAGFRDSLSRDEEFLLVISNDRRAKLGR